jgi:RNA polymerase sigma-70 factor, ECF subfamily
MFAPNVVRTLDGRVESRGPFKHMPSSKVQPALELSLPATLGADDAAASRAAHDGVLLLFDECGTGLRRYLSSFGLGQAATDDLVQDVFMSLFRHLRLGRPQTNLKGWLFQVGHNLALKQRQRGQKRLEIESDWDTVVAERAIDPASNPEEQLADDRRRLKLRAVVRAMPERDRRCLYLRAEGLSYRDIARTLGISLGSVAKSLTRAVTRLTTADMR